MHSTYHFNSASELTIDILEAIKIAFKSKPITLTISEDEEEDTTAFFMNRPIDKEILLQSIAQDKNNQIVKNVIIAD
jgi:hypothetical protein